MKDEYQSLVEMLIQAMEDSFHSSLRLREISKTSVRMASTLFYRVEQRKRMFFHIRITLFIFNIKKF